MGDDTWDTSDFLKRYTSKPSDNVNHINDEEMNSSVESDQISQVEVFSHYNDDTVFCTPENLEDRLQYLNQELTILGFPPIFDKGQNSKYGKDVNGNFDVTKLVNCTYDLMKRHNRQLRIKDDLEARQIRSDNDNDALLQTQDRLRHENESLKRENALSLYREKELGKKCTCFQQDIKNEREEKRKMKSDVDHLRKQFYHESKRLEKEISRLKDKVHQSLSDKSSQGQKIAIDILNPLIRADGKRSRWKVGTKKDEEEMYRLVIANYEEKEKVLLMENRDMRESLSYVHKSLVEIDPSFTTEIFDEETKQYQMPFHMVKEDVNNKLQYVIMSLKSKVEKADEKSKADTSTTPNEEVSALVDESNKELSAKLEQCKAIIASQEKLIQGMKDGYNEEAFEKLLMTFGAREDEIIEYEERKRLLQEEQRKYDEDRKQFTAYVLKIAKEKEELEKERVEFYMHCISSPVVNKEMKISPQKVGAFKSTTNKSCPTTPNFSAAPRRNNNKKQKTPSTGELYKYMSLPYDGTSPKKSPGGISNLEGSYQYQEQNSPVRRNSLRKVREHSDKIRKAVEDRQHKSVGEGDDKRRNILSELENV